MTPNDAKRKLPNGAVAIDDLDRRITGPEIDAALRRARRDLGERIAQRDGRPTLKSLRLAAGLTQQRLADRIGTHQARIARLEARPLTEKPGFDVMKRLAAALGVDWNTLAVALDD
jgi:ribosome-binding protein aMBF1 (putative translation factor)